MKISFQEKRDRLQSFYRKVTNKPIDREISGANVSQIWIIIRRVLFYLKSNKSFKSDNSF